MSSKQEIKVSITGEATGLQRALRSVTGSLSGLSGELTALQGLAARALNFGAIGGAASLAGLVAMTKSVADTADELGKLSLKTGITTEKLAELRYAASLSDVSNEALTGSLAKLAKAIVDASDGTGTSADAFSRLGISVRDTNGQIKSTDAVFAELAARFADLPDGPEKAAAAMAIFGKTGADLIPLLNSGADGLRAMGDEARKFGLTISTETANAAQEFNDNLTRMQAVQTGLVTQLAAELMPAMRDASAAFVDVAKSVDLVGPVAQFAITLFQTLVVLGSDVAFVFRGIGREIGGIAAQLAALATGDIDGFRAIGQAMREDAEAARKSLDDFQARILSIGQANAAAEAKALDAKAKQKELNKEIIALAKLRQDEAKKAGDEELKGAEKLKEALRAAWQASIDGARKARDEAQKLFQAAADARLSGQDKADERRNRGLSPEEQGAVAAQQGEAARNAASIAALQAKLAALRGDSAAVEKLSAEALKQAQRAEQFADKIPDDNSAANLLEEVAKIRETAIAAQAQAKQAQAAALEEQAQAQAKTLADLETRLAALKKAAGEIPVNVQITEAESRIAKLKAEIEKGAVMPVTVQTTPASGEQAPGFAYGGIIRGPGSGTSDSIIARLSNGEGIIRNAAVSYYGENLIHRINSLQLPKFASGGIVGGGSAKSSGTPVVLDFGKLGRYNAEASEDTASALVRVFKRAALTHGRR